MEKQICEFYPLVKPCYVITDDGEVINKETGNHITPVQQRGYIWVPLMRIIGGITNIPVHRIKMMAFNPVKGMDKLQVNHIDGDKTNNDLANLEWVTPKENIHHAWKTGLSSAKNIQGEKSNFCYHSKELALKVIELLKTNQYTDKEIAEMTGTNAHSFVSKIRRRETWKHLTKDYDGVLGKAKRGKNF